MIHELKENIKCLCWKWDYGINEIVHKEENIIKKLKKIINMDGN